VQLNVSHEGVAVLLELIVRRVTIANTLMCAASPTWVLMLTYIRLIFIAWHDMVPSCATRRTRRDVVRVTSSEIVRSYFCQKVICLWFWAGPRKPEFPDAETSFHYFFLSSHYLNRR
jgi:hypothetical protein